MNAFPLRLRRILDARTGRALMLSFTSGMEVGVSPGWADLPGMIGALAATRQMTAAVVRAGVLPSVFERFGHLPCGVVVDLLGGTWLNPQPNLPAQICSLEQAVRAGADAVLASISLGGPDESARLRLCGQLARECAAWGMPLILRMDTLALPGQRQYSAVLSGQGARLAYELGADVAVVPGCDSGIAFAEALRGIDVPVLVGGGPRLDTDDELLKSMDVAMSYGAHGVALSASMFCRAGQPSATLAALADVVLAAEPCVFADH
jgi:DhnA family fructose-bisphosphate aldolase class Ia